MTGKLTALPERGGVEAKEQRRETERGKRERVSNHQLCSADNNSVLLEWEQSRGVDPCPTHLVSNEETSQMYNQNTLTARGGCHDGMC